MSVKANNEKKLIRNIEQIIKNYIKVDGELLENLAKEDIDQFKEIIGSKSQDNFLEIIVEEYKGFLRELFDKLKFQNESNIQSIKEEQKRIKDFEKIKGKRVLRKKKVKSLAPRKFKPNKWTNKENNFIKRMIRNNVKSGEIITKLNEKRNNEGLASRTNSSVYNKIHRLKKEDEDK